MKIIVGKCKLEIETKGGENKCFEIVGQGSVSRFQQSFGFFKPKFGNPEIRWVKTALEIASKMMPEIKRNGGIVIEDEWIDFNNIKHMRIVNRDDNFQIDKEVDDIEWD